MTNLMCATNLCSDVFIASDVRATSLQALMLDILLEFEIGLEFLRQAGILLG